jgi:hypothetical protein
MTKDEWRIMVSLRSVFQCENDRIQTSLNSLNDILTLSFPLFFASNLKPPTAEGSAFSFELIQP